MIYQENPERHYDFNRSDLDDECVDTPALVCYCPDDCNCHYSWRTNFCGCKGHEVTK